MEGANPIPQPKNPALEAAYNSAYDLLNDEGDDFDDAGKPIKIPVDSPLFANYKRKLDAYSNAVASFMGEYSKYDLSKPEDQRTWSVIGPSQQRRLTTAWNDFQNAQAKKIEDALATLAQSSQNQVGRVFSDAQAKLELLKKASLRDPMDSYYPTYASPANWYSSSASSAWPEIGFSSANYQINQRSNFTSYGGGASFSLGLWSVGGGASHSTERRHMDSQTDELNVSFRYARIGIERPWMNAMIFDLPGWTYSPVQKGGISSGNPKNADGTLMTVIPTAFIVVRDLKISAKWSKQESDFIHEKLKASARVGWGPFSVGGSYQSESSSFRFKSDFDGRTLSALGPQLMAFICTVLPMSPK